MSWCVLHVRPKTEKKVAVVCEKHGVGHYLPLREETKIYQRRKVTVHKPLFQGYVFADITPVGKKQVLRTNYIVQIIPSIDEDQLLFELDQLRRALTGDPRLQAKHALCEGTPVRIKAGVFAGVEGVVDRARKPGEVQLNIHMVGQSITLTVDPDYLEKL